MQIRHIVIASDLSPAARLAYPHAAAFARAFGARVTLLHIDELSGSTGRASPAMDDYLKLVSLVWKSSATALSCR